MQESIKVLFAMTVVSLAILIFISIIMVSEQACHKWIGPWMTSGDSAAIFIFCEGQ